MMLRIRPPSAAKTSAVQSGKSLAVLPAPLKSAAGTTPLDALMFSACTEPSLPVSTSTPFSVFRLAALAPGVRRTTRPSAA